MKCGYGVDVGGTTLKIGWFREDGMLLKHWEIPTDLSEGGKNILPDLAAAIRGFEEEEGVLSEDVLGIGLGIPGPVVDGVVNKCVNLGWDITPVEDELSALTGYTVRANNDANVAALGEMWQGGGRGHKNVVMVTLGTGVGGGIIVGGRVVSGAHGAGGEIGHITVNRDETELCGCGKRGCLEQYASATGVVNIGRKMLASSGAPSAMRAISPLTAKDIFACAKEGDALALSVVEQFGDALGEALADVSAVSDPEIFVLGGGISKAGEIVTEVTKKYYQKYAFHASRGARFVLSRLDADAGMYGSFYLLLQ